VHTRIQQEMSCSWRSCADAAGFMAQLDILWVGSNDLSSQAEALCQIGSGLSVVRTQDAWSRSTRCRSWSRGVVFSGKGEIAGSSGSGEKPELGPIKGPSEMLEETLYNFSLMKSLFFFEVSRKSPK